MRVQVLSSNEPAGSSDAIRKLLRPRGARRGGIAPTGAAATARISASTLWLLGASLDDRGRGGALAETPDSLDRVLDRVWSEATRSARAMPPLACRLTRQVTLTDMIRPEADGVGAIVLTMRHSGDYTHLAHQHAPPGRDVARVGEAWARLMELSTNGAVRIDGAGARAGLLSLNFLVAACADSYDAREPAQAVRTHVISNYRGGRTAARLDQFAECLRALVHTHVFPHELVGFFGGLVSWVTQDELASVTAVCMGAQAAAHTGLPGRPRSSVCVPACAFVDLDAEFHAGRPGAAFLYLVFTYGQRRGQEMCRVHVVKSQSPPRGLESLLERMFGRLRVTNTIHGIEDMDAPPAGQAEIFPLVGLSRDPRSPRCSASEVTVPRFYARLHQWRPDLRGRPTARTATYAAFAPIGTVPEDTARYTQRVERLGSVSVPVVVLEGVVWQPGEWKSCA
ncbi:capsid triplex subunit 1 [Bovine alphaherpesvirus 2]|uniref:Capsid triplex subunit 1 n=1 Tax=Bovine alphaherpesvirus 2 TaxID=10295 RepID=A0A7T1P462_9ALPH|nr:capsid triplex subunit 1 [Bovine alphaherpesvirus 2]